MRSIRAVARAIGGGVSVVVTATAPYARGLQRGTGRTTARPFLGLPEDARLAADFFTGRRR
jgi:hypothetical protein